MPGVGWGGVLDAWQVGELFIGRVKIRSIFTVKHYRIMTQALLIVHLVSPDHL